MDIFYVNPIADELEDIIKQEKTKEQKENDQEED